MTRLQRTRLNAAIKALAAAGSSGGEGHLRDRLRRAFEHGTFAEQADECARARSWASIVRSADDPKKLATARDAIGLLWASMEDE